MGQFRLMQIIVLEIIKSNLHHKSKVCHHHEVIQLQTELAKIIISLWLHFYLCYCYSHMDCTDTPLSITSRPTWGESRINTAGDEDKEPLTALIWLNPYCSTFHTAPIVNLAVLALQTDCCIDCEYLNVTSVLILCLLRGILMRHSRYLMHHHNPGCHWLVQVKVDIFHFINTASAMCSQCIIPANKHLF